MDKINIGDDMFEEFEDDELNLEEELEDLEMEEDYEEEADPPPNRRKRNPGSSRKQRQPKQKKVRREKKERKVSDANVTKVKRMFSKHAYIGLGCIVFAFLISFILQPALTGVIGRQVEVVRVKTTITAGSKITESNVETVKVNRASIPADAIKKKEDVIDKFTDSKLVAGDYFMKSKINNSQFGGGVYLEGLDGSKRIMSITIPDFATGLSAKLKAGDIVTIYGATPANEDKATTYPQLKYVKVLATTMDTGIDESDASGGTTTQPKTVTVLVNDVQAELLAGINQNGKLHIILAYRGEQDKADVFLQEQDKYFSTNKP